MLASVVAAGTLFIAAPTPAEAANKESMYRIGTYAAGAATAYGLLKNKDTIALLGAAGTYFAHRGWKSEINKRHQRPGNRNYRVRRNRR
jgi:hypothetical protein